MSTPILALVAAIPVYIVMLNLCGFLTLPLYALTPETRAKRQAPKELERKLTVGQGQDKNEG